MLCSTSPRAWLQGRPLTSIINEAHENVRYLPGIMLPDNLFAMPNLEAAAAGADVLVFCVPHQFMRGIVRQLRGKARFCRAPRAVFCPALPAHRRAFRESHSARSSVGPGSCTTRLCRRGTMSTLAAALAFSRLFLA